jgi:signal transduction histidine kinase
VSGVAFVEDLYRDNMLAYGIIYTPLIATAVLHKNRSGLWIVTAVACVLVVIGAFFPVVNPDLMDLIGNRFLSILAILATAAFVRHARNNQDRLAAETRRAEAAEQIKTQILTNLSQEIRTPLHSLLGVLTLTMADSRPDQRRPLGQIRSDGKQLLATIDNLIDLTQIKEHKLKRQTIDIATIARDAAESAGATARERQVTVVMSGEPETKAVGDSWAMRRILDNLLANALRLTPPGGTVSVAVSRAEGSVTASVSDTGRGLPHALTEEFQENAAESDGSALTTTGATGLALSSRLARAMNGRLTARNGPDVGATVSLSLPAG